MDTHEATLDGETVTFRVGTMGDALDALVANHPGAGAPKVRLIRRPADGETIEEAARSATNKEFSTFSAPIVDESAEVRIAAQHEALRAGGVAIDTREQLFSTGTRMARVGYDSQERRRREHEAKLPVLDAAAALSAVVAAEKRESFCLSAAEIAEKISANGKVRFDGLALREQSIRGLLSRAQSPALSYVLGLRERTRALPAQRRADTAQIAEVLRHELRAAGDVEFKLRVRRGVGDVFAAVSPDYAEADAPDLIDRLQNGLPADARGSWAYDPTTTTWELRASVWTPTPVAEQAVGEPFEGYVSFQSRDDGTSALRGGGGVQMLRCLNASTYAAGASRLARRHVGAILLDVQQMIVSAKAAIDALCAAWGRARESFAEFDDGPIPIQKAIPGIYSGELFDRRSELAGVLPGRSGDHARGLTKAYFDERRDPERICRADIAQGWTRYVQAQPAPVRRDAERAIGSWLASDERLRYDAGRAQAFAG